MTLSHILCPLRKKKIQLSPEEQVRQKLIGWLAQARGIPLDSMMIEANLRQFGAQWDWRMDLLVMKKKGGQSRPWILCECKAPGQFKKEAWLAQVERYISVIQPDYLLGTDGSGLWLYKWDGEQYQVEKDLPKWG